MADLAISKFDPLVAKLQALVEDSKKITVTDVRNDEQLKASKKMRLALRDARVALTKQGKEMREDALAFQKAVIAKEKELVGIVEPEEERLQHYEDQAAEVKEIQRREALLPARKQKLDEIGDGKQALDDELLRMDDASFNAYYNGRVGDWQRKKEADLAAREKAIKDEEDRQRREKEKSEAEERGRQQEKERIEREKKEEGERAMREAEQKVKARMDRVTALGLTWLPDQQSFVLEDYNVAMVDIKTLTDEQFDHIIKNIQGEMKRRKDAAAEAQREKEEKERLEKEEAYKGFLSSHGWTEETKEDFIVHRAPGVVTLFKKVGEYRE